MPAAAAIAGAAALGTLLVYIFGAIRFVDNACSNIESVLPREIIGQDLALGQLTDVICQHLAQKNPKKALVISVHGPPGVGKTYTHLWLARSLYNKQPSSDLHCPGMHCKGYKVVYGLDYLVTEAAARLDQLRGEVVAHLSAAPEALLVVEEYDKLDCQARGLWRQLLAHPERANITSKRAVILMESNLGMAELEELLTRMGDRNKVTLESAEQLLRSVVFAQWQASRCESYEDTLKFMSMIDVFMPYLPLERQQMPQLVELALRDRAALLRQQKVTLTWEPEVTTYIAEKVDFSGRYPLDGAKVVESTMTRQVARPLRKAAAVPGCLTKKGCTVKLKVAGKKLQLVIQNNTADGAQMSVLMPDQREL